VSFEFRKMAHPPYSPDLALYDFFPFGAMKQAFAGQHFGTIDDLFMSVVAFLRGFSNRVFEEGFLRSSCRPLFRNGYGNYSHAVKAVENTLSEHDKTEYLLL
jgi:hypothetical protein